jgi:hypothetical protein
MQMISRRELLGHAIGGMAAMSSLGLVSLRAAEAPAREGYVRLPEEFFTEVELSAGEIPEFPVGIGPYRFPHSCVTELRGSHTHVSVSCRGDYRRVPIWGLGGIGLTTSAAMIDHRTRLNVVMADLMDWTCRLAHGRSLMPTTRENAETRIREKLKRKFRFRTDRFVKFWERDGILYGVNTAMTDTMIHVVQSMQGGKARIRGSEVVGEQGLAILDSRVIMAEHIIG